MRAHGPSIRSRLTVLVVVATVPLTLFAAVLLMSAYRVNAGLIEDTAVSSAHRAEAAVDALIGRAEAIGATFAEVQPAALDDATRFERAAKQVLAAARLDAALEIIDRDGRVVAHTMGLADDGTHPAALPSVVRRVFETQRTQVTGLYLGPYTHRPQIAVHVPMIRDGKVVYDIAVLPSARSIGEAATPRGLDEGWFTLVVDRDGRVIADTDNPNDAPDVTLPELVVKALEMPGDGFKSVMFPGGKHVLLGFTHVERTGWTIATGVPAWVVRGPLLRSIGALGLAGALVLAVSLLLGLLIGRRVIQPLGALARQASGLKLQEATNLQRWPKSWRGVAEVEAVGFALLDAGETLRARSAEREAALRRAEASEARLLLAQEIGAIGTWELDLQDGTRRWSAGEMKLYGLDPAATPPDEPAWLDLLHPDDRPLVEAALASARQAATTLRLVFRVRQPRGAIRWLRIAARNEMEDGRPARLIGTSIDVTERQEAERSLRQSATRLEGEVAEGRRDLERSEQRFRTYFEYSTDALLIVRVEPERDFIYESINRAGENLFGLAQDEIAGREPDEVFAPDTAYAERAAYRRAVARIGEKVTVQRTLEYPAGQLHLETILIAVADPADPAIVRVISGSRDLTERQRIESRLQHAQRLEAVGQLTGGVAHDFNNLLTVVIGNLSLLRRRMQDDERSARYLASVEAAAQRGAKLTASLLAFSRRQTLNVEQLDIGARIAESATLLQRAIGEEIEFSLSIAPDLPAANADASQLEAAVLNLVINARDALGEAMAARATRSGTLRISVRTAALVASDLMGNDEARPGTFVAIAVADDGPGMSQAVRARAFEPFFTTKDIGRGTGLGLSQVFGFVRQLGGHVQIDSVEGSGTVVTLYLPVAMSLPPELAPLPVEPDTLPGGASVLVVEDDLNIRDITAELLRDVGLRVLTATTGPAALDVLRGPERVDLLFTDVVMPGGATGVDLARAAQELRPELPVLLTSGYTGPALMRYGPVSEFAILAKPYSRAALLERIGALLSVAPVIE